MTDKVGIFEHCVGASINRKEGYCVDDNARALSVCLKVKGKEKEKAQQLIPIYLSFLGWACDKGGFHQDLNPDLTWKDTAKVEDGYGRAIAALAETILLAEKEEQKNTAESIFDRQIALIPLIKHPRVMAYAIIAISNRVKSGIKRKSSDYKKELIFLTDMLIKNYQKYSSGTWKWYENALTYENARLPLSLFYTFQVTKDDKYLVVAKESLDFLIEQTFDRSKDCFSFIGHRGWFPKGGAKSVSGQQPVEAGGTVEACILSYKITGNIRYLDFAKKAFEWYGGRNISCLSLIDEESGGIKDGIEPYGINQNEGAESILSYIQAYLALEETKL
jgi:hypothetical protein